MKLLSLAKKLDFTTEEQYFNYCVESYINGQIQQAKSLFKNMAKADKHQLISYIDNNMANDEIHNFFVSLF